MRMSRFAYFAEFLIFPPLLLIFAVFAFRHAIAPRPTAWVLIYLAGLLTWTLLEYLLHRFVFHHAPLLAPLHESHHQNPEALIGTPAWVSVSLGVVAVAGPCWAVFGLGVAAAATAGMATGYLLYVFVHYAIHHWQPRPGSYLYRARRRHALHHHFSDEGNFGVSTGLWDHVFGTALESGREGLRRHPRRN